MRVNVDDVAFMDRRFKLLAGRLGMTWQEALGRCLPVWALAYAKRSAVLPAGDVDALAERPGFAAAMVGAELAIAELDGVYLCGVTERIDFLLLQDAKREQARQAKARAAGVQLPAGRSRGKVPREVDIPREGPAEPSRGTFPGDVPGEGPYSPDLTPDLTPEEDPPPARAISPSTEHAAAVVVPDAEPPARQRAEHREHPAVRATPPSPEQAAAAVLPGAEPPARQRAEHREHPHVAAAVAPGAEPPAGQRAQRRELQLELRGVLERARASVAAELGLEARPLLAQDPGERALAMRLVDAGEQLATARDETLHAIAIAAAEARRDRSVQWLTGAIFEERTFRRLVGMTLEDAARSRAGPRSSAERAPASPEPIRKIKTL